MPVTAGKMTGSAARTKECFMNHIGSPDNGSASSDSRNKQPDNLNAILDLLLDVTCDVDEVSLDDVLSTIGRRSFGPVLVLVGLITLAPVIGDIPGVPTMMAVIVLLTVAQLALQAEHFWLPRWLLKRSVSSKKMHKAVAALRKPSRFVDRLMKPRLTALVLGPSRYAVALACGLTALLTPALEFIPFSGSGAGMIWTLFGLALITRDGALALMGYSITGVIVAIIVANLV